MKLLLIGSDETWSIEKHYRKYLAAAENVEVHFCPIQSEFYKHYNKSVLHKILFKAGISGLSGRLDEMARQKVIECNPNIVWVFKGMELRPSFFAWVKSKGIKLVNYNPDNPFVFSGAGSGNQNVRASIKLFDLHLTYDNDVREKIEKEYKIPCKILPFGFELSDTLYKECIRQEEVRKVCFLGNPDSERAAFIEDIAKNLPIDVYGNNWSSFTKHPNISCFPPVYGDDAWKVLYRYRVQLNLMRIHNPASHNMRSFEVPGAGGIGLFPDTMDHRTYFTEGRELFLYKGKNDCAAIAKEIIQFSTGQADEIRKHARERSINAGYSYAARTQQVLQMFKELAG